MKHAFPFASETLYETALWNETSKHEVDSGVLVYNKIYLSSFFGLLNVCKPLTDIIVYIKGNLNRKPMQKHIQWVS